MSILLRKDVCPYGPLGNTLVKPMAWRVLNDNKRFVNDWHTLIKNWRSWKRVHPMTILDNRLHERYKNNMRHWWFALSKYEQDRLFSIRRDTGQKAMSHFPGPRYQKGTIMMGASGTSANFLTDIVLTLSSADNTAFNFDFSPPSPLEAGFQVLRAGTLQRINSSGTNQINNTTDWINDAAKTSTVGDGYEVIWNQLTGTTNNENFTEDVWITISATRRVSHSTTAPAATKTMEFDIGEDGTSTSDVNQDYTYESGDLV